MSQPQVTRAESCIWGGGGNKWQWKTRGLWQNIDNILLLPESGEGITDSLRVETNKLVLHFSSNSASKITRKMDL